MLRAIGQAAAMLGISADTLRYYERIKLLPPPSRSAGGKRIYREADLARLRFIRRAQRVGFSLEEIAKLLRFRENPVRSSRAVRALAARKHAAIGEQLKLLKQMETELALLISICRGDVATCPILDRLEGRRTKSTSPDGRPARAENLAVSAEDGHRHSLGRPHFEHMHRMPGRASRRRR